MSQSVNVETSSAKPKRQYRKGNPLSLSERQQSSLARKRETHKELRVFLPNALKDQFQELCEAKGITQAQMIEKLVSETVQSELYKK